MNVSPDIYMSGQKRLFKLKKKALIGYDML